MAEGAEYDYDRARDRHDYLRAVPLAAGSALVLGAGSFDTSVWVSPAGETVVAQVECSEPDADIGRMLAGGEGQSKLVSTTEFEFHSSKLVIFDSAYAGDEETERLSFSLVPGRYRVSTEEIEPPDASLVVHRFERI